MFMKTGPKNILLITSDQQHFFTLGCENPEVPTPNLDRLCRQGTRFSRAYCPNPTCTPTRATLITGMMPSRHGAWTLGTKLNEQIPTLPGRLAQNGYYTGLVGKAHFQPLKGTEEYPTIESHPTLRDLDFWRNFRGDWYGFQRVETARMHADEGHVGGHYALWMEEKGFHDWENYFQHPDTYTLERKKEYTGKNHRHWNLPEEFHYNHWTAERTIDFIAEAQEDQKPFYIWSSFHDPHPPYIVPEPWASMIDPAKVSVPRMQEGEHNLNPPHFRYAAVEDNRDFWETSRKDQGAIHGGGFQGNYPEEELRKDIACYYGMIAFMDQQIGRILDELDRRGLTDNTLVVFTTDHGHFLGQHGLREKAIHHYEDLIRVPMIARLPGVIPQGVVNEDLQNLVDLPASFLKFTDQEIPCYYQGLDQRDSWRGKGPARTASLTENHHGYTRFHMNTLVCQRYKMTVHRDSDEGELFDLEEDPGETRNLWKDPNFASIRSQLLHRYARELMAAETPAMPRTGPA